ESARDRDLPRPKARCGRRPGAFPCRHGARRRHRPRACGDGRAARDARAPAERAPPPRGRQQVHGRPRARRRRLARAHGRAVPDGARCASGRRGLCHGGGARVHAARLRGAPARGGQAAAPRRSGARRRRQRLDRPRAGREGLRRRPRARSRPRAGTEGARARAPRDARAAGRRRCRCPVRARARALGRAARPHAPRGRARTSARPRSARRRSAPPVVRARSRGAVRLRRRPEGPRHARRRARARAARLGARAALARNRRHRRRAHRDHRGVSREGHGAAACRGRGRGCAAACLGRGEAAGRAYRERSRRRSAARASLMHRSELTIDLAALRSNVRTLLRTLAGAELWAVVKANAYGHGASDVAGAALGEGATALCVATVAEALDLRREFPSARIVVMGPTTSNREVAHAREANLELVVSSNEIPDGVRVHLKLDTGMGRWGLSELTGSPPFEVVGLMSHLATADTDAAYAEWQIERFRAATSSFSHLTRHIANSAGALRYPAARFDAARCGIALYGLSPFGTDPADDGLTPVLSWTL